jgi:GrpB-like predicted nucleotidyltransferase (UPF0157 family)
LRIHRFDVDVSIPITSFGSRFSIGPLTSPDARVRVQILHLPAGGVIGRHEAAATQLVACVAGSGRVSGADGSWRDLEPGYAATWEPGEEHETRSEDGMTLVCIEGEFDVWAMSVTKDIVVREYDPEWPVTFAAIADRIWPAIEHIAVRIDHVGSTSVPGLAAKPIIDMDIVVGAEEDKPAVATAIETLGYVWRGNLGVEGREAYRRTGAARELPEHNLYCVVEDNKAHLDHWLLRDLLREDADARERYAALKRRNAAEVDRDMDLYVARKAKLVAELLARARAERGLPPADYWDPDAP